MKINNETVAYLEKLARIELTDEERVECCSDLQDIVSHMDILSELDTQDAEPLSQSFSAKNVMREDEVKPSLDRDTALKNAPRVKDVFFSVPKTVE